MTTTIQEYRTISITFEEAIQRLESNGQLSDRRRRDLISALRTTARLLARNPLELTTSMETLRPQLTEIHPVQAGISAKRLANIKSDLAAAIRLTTPHIRVRRRPIASDDLAQTPAADLASVWQTFRNNLEMSWQAHQLSRLSRFCSAHGISPSDMSDTVMLSFHAYLSQHHLAKDPAAIVKQTRQTWNGFITRTGADLPRLSKPPLQRFITRPLTDYPSSFQEDVERWISRQSGDDFLDEDGPLRPLRPTTLRNIRAHIRQFAHALVEEGVEPQTLRSLTDLISTNHFRKGLNHFVRRNNGKPPAWLGNVAATLLAIAKHHLRLEGNELKSIATMKARITARQDGLTQKNRTRLGAFDEEANVERLLRLPEHMFRRYAGLQHLIKRDALNMMHSVAISILLACPMRAANLARLDRSQHLKWSGTAKNRRLSIAVPGSEVKNGEAIEIVLPKDTARMIQRYIDAGHSVLTSKTSDALFPMTDGRPRLPSHLAQDMCRMIARETGIIMNAHLFRHLAGKLYLNACPGDYETVRRLLGHRKLATTTSFYAPLESRRAVERYDAVVLSNRRRDR